MQPTIIGVLVALLGMAALFSPIEMAVTTAILLTLLGSGAAINLPALGGASILAGPFFTGFVVLRNFLIRGGAARFFTALLPPSAGFWLLLAVLYGIFASFFVAPFFYNEIMVYPISRGTSGEATFYLEPLGFSSGNLTQGVYAIGQVLLFAGISALVVTATLHRKALDALVLLACMHVFVSLLDLVTFFTGTGFLIDWLRTASYTTWQSNTIAGLKRISGLFPEASMYSIYAMTILGVLLSLLISGYRARITTPLFFATLLLLIISTSTTAYVSLAIAGLLLLVLAIKRAALLQGFKLLRLLLLSLAALLLAAAMAMVIFPQLSGAAEILIEETLLTKMESDSGVDRSLLNADALQTFFDTMGLGTGLGSVRTSSFVLTLLSNIGAIGTLAFCLFLARLLFPGEPGGKSRETLILGRAARSGVIGALIGASVSYHVFDLGPLFYILAALSTPKLLYPRRTLPQRRWTAPGRFPRSGARRDGWRACRGLFAPIVAATP